MKLLERESLPFDPSVTTSERVANCILTNREGKIGIKFSQYMDSLMKDSGIKPDEKGSWPELEEKDKVTIDKIFQEIYKDWKETSNKYLKDRLKGQLVEWLVFKGLIEAYKNPDPKRFRISKSTDPYVDKELHTDLFINLLIGNKMRNFGLDITISNAKYFDKLGKYHQMVKEKGLAWSDNSIPILLDINNPKKPVYLSDQRLVTIIEDPQNRKSFGKIFYEYGFLEQINDDNRLPELRLNLGKRNVEKLKKLPSVA